MYEIEVKLPTGEVLEYDYTNLRTALDTGEFINMVGKSIHLAQIKDETARIKEEEELQKLTQKQQEDERKLLVQQILDKKAQEDRLEQKAMVKEVLTEAGVISKK